MQTMIRVRTELKSEDTTWLTYSLDVLSSFFNMTPPPININKQIPIKVANFNSLTYEIYKY